MKNKLNGILTIIGFCLTLTVQSQTNPNHVYVNGGASVTGLLFNTLLNGDSVKYSVKNRPAIQFGYDRILNDWLSLGAGFSNQQFHITFNEFVDDNNVLQTGDFKADLTRNHVHIKALAGKYEEKYALYAGLRLGFVWFVSDLSMEKRELRAFEKVDKWLSAGRPTLGMPIGGRYYFTDNIGVNLELNLGAPHILSSGISVKF